MEGVKGEGPLMEGVIYKIYSDDVDEIYIGSTLDLSKRKTYHKRACYDKRSIKYTYKLYQFIRAHGGFYKFKFSILETVKLQNKDQLRILEQDHILRNENAVLNTNNAFTDVKEYKKKYFQDHKTEHKLYMRKWRKRKHVLEKRVKPFPMIHQFNKLKIRKIE